MSEWRVDEYGLPGETDLWTDGTVTVEIPKSLTRRMEADHAAARVLADAVEALRKIRRLPQTWAHPADAANEAIDTARDFFAAHPDLTAEGGAGR